MDRFAFTSSLIATVTLAVVLATKPGPAAPRDVPRDTWGITTIHPCRQANAPRIETARDHYLVADFHGAALLETDRMVVGDYEVLADAWPVGMGGVNPPIERYRALLAARTADLRLGGAHLPAIEATLYRVAIQAGAAFMGAKQYSEAERAIDVAMAFGPATPTTHAIRGALRDNGF